MKNHWNFNNRLRICGNTHKSEYPLIKSNNEERP